MDDFNPKKENIPYTIAIIKPDLTQSDEKVKEVLATIEDKGFCILQMIKKELTKQEVLNLYYKHTDKDFFDTMGKYLMNGESVVMLLTTDEEDPIAKWKGLIGLPDPVEAKKAKPESLRALYGTSLIKNAVHGSDNKYDANKERDIFKFPTPQRVPEFKFEKFKITLDMLLKFIYPPNLEHSDVNARLDIFAMYGPVLNHHSIDACFCKPCAKLGREYLQKVISDKVDEKKLKLGITAKPTLSGSRSATVMRTANTPKVNVSPVRLLDERGIIELWPHLCDNCRTHCENHVHLVCGREQQHVMTDQEVNELSNEINKKELHKLLAKEKGSTADVMIEYLEIKEPKEIQYDRKLIAYLFRAIKTDYYERYNFLEMQNIVLEDRRIRMNAWVSKLIGKPLDAFVNPKLLETDVPQAARLDPNNINFVLNRTNPLSYSIKPRDINAVPTQFKESIVDKKKLRANEEKIVLMKLLHRNSHHIVSIDEVENSKDFERNVFIIRHNYHPGRNGTWNNYSTLKGIRKGTYVKTIVSQKKKLIE